jgi:DNA-binding GntR family transcriptional regulator
MQASTRSGGAIERLSESFTAAEVIEAVHDDMVFGTYKPRQRLVESEMSERYGVSRSVVRRVLDDLEHRGVISRQANRGAIVHDFSLEEVRDICEVRAMLHRRAAETIPLPADPEWLAEIADRQRLHASAVTARDAVLAYRANKAFHATFFSATPNRFLLRKIDEVDWLMDIVRSYRIMGPALKERAPREHAAIVEAARSGARDEMVRLCLAHVPDADEIYERISSWAFE